MMQHTEISMGTSISFHNNHNNKASWQLNVAPLIRITTSVGIYILCMITQDMYYMYFDILICILKYGRYGGNRLRHLSEKQRVSPNELVP